MDCLGLLTAIKAHFMADRILAISLQGKLPLLQRHKYLLEYSEMSTLNVSCTEVMHQMSE